MRIDLLHVKPAPFALDAQVVGAFSARDFPIVTYITRKRAESLARLGSSEPEFRLVFTMHGKGTLEVSLACLHGRTMCREHREKKKGLTRSARSSAAYGYSLVWHCTKP